jgi:hypothetical protein
MARGGARPGAGRKKSDKPKAPRVRARKVKLNPPLKNKGGRPSVFQIEFVAQAQKLCELGATDQEIADFFGVSRQTIYRWSHDNSEFCYALKVGKESIDDRVERSMYHKAVGYTHEAEKIVVDAKSGRGCKRAQMSTNERILSGNDKILSRIEEILSIA